MNDNKVVMFKYLWWDVDNYGRGVKVDEYGVTLAKTSKIVNSVAARRKKGIQSLLSRRNLAPPSHLQQANLLSNNDGVHEKKASSSSHSQVRRIFDSLFNDDGVYKKKQILKSLIN
ncbi:hypothetical protein Ahy_A01g003335 [Arachis hypogaea]|uniref:Uncharacterized protein n=1 Tax=Arachis hypogaea TaxID=3818 RepID=A0A445ESQ7_ARAHY|nr:hypothetical protein Ahy_A01g003335 [Arachis hypogaea]